MSRKSNPNSSLGGAGRGTRRLDNIPDTPVGQRAGAGYSSYSGDELAGLHQRAAAKPKAQPAPPPRVSSRQGKKNGFLVMRGFAPGQEDVVAELRRLRGGVHAILEECGGRPTKILPGSLEGAVLLGKLAIGDAHRSQAVRCLSKDQIIGHIRERQPPSYTDTITAVVGGVAILGGDGNRAGQVAITIIGSNIQTETDAAHKALQKLADRDPDSDVCLRWGSASIPLSVGGLHIPAPEQEAIVQLGTAAFPVGTPLRLAPDQFLP